jgi:hypothetical protein
VTVGSQEENERFITALQASLLEMEADGVPKEATAEENGGEFKF